MAKMTSLERFHLSYTIDNETECWLWSKYKDKDLYGRFKDNGTVHRSHRWIYQVINGPLPSEVHVHHLCFNSSCCNPSHLKAVTGAENQRENYRHNRCARQKLSPDDVNTIKKIYEEGKPVKELANEYEVSLSAIYSAINGRAWNWLNETNT